jgi:hypothetical protein
MAAKTDLPKELQALVEDVGRPVTSDDIDVYRELQRIKDETFRLRTVLRAWKDQQAQDRKLRSRYATWLMIAMGIQMLVVNVVYILMGCGILSYEQWTANTFIMGVFAEVAALVLLIVKYLFTPASDKILDLMKGQKNGKG